MSVVKARNPNAPHCPSATEPAATCTPVRIWHPHIHSTPITTVQQLRQLTNDQYPGLTRSPQFPQLLTDAETHLALIAQLHNQYDLKRGDRTRLAHQVGTSRQLVTAYVQAARKPRLYFLIEHSLAKPDAQAKIATIHRDNHGLHSTDDVKRRLATYYPADEPARAARHQQRLTQCDQYFKALDLLKDGGCYLDVARQLGTRHSQIQRWLDGQRPDLVELTRRIPDQNPTSGKKWLPTKMEGNFRPTHFVRAPEIINAWTEVSSVLEHLDSLDNRDMQRWQGQLGRISKEAAFSYLLGIMVSDCGRSSRNRTSKRIDLRLSKIHPWAKQLGEAACYCLGQIGIAAKQVEDRDSSTGRHTCYSWNSENSPLISWIDKTCLGLQPHERTTYTPIKADWLLRAPAEIRKKFLQGLNDGDGWASIKGQSLGNACQPNITFFEQLLATFDIDSTDDGKRVRITKAASIIRAAELPFFQHAIERQRNAKKLAEMMRARLNKETSPMPDDVIASILQLHEQGKTFGEIAEAVYNQHGVFYDQRRIWHVIQSEQADKHH